MSIAGNVLSILNIVRSFSPANIANQLTAIGLKLDRLIQMTSGPETGFFIRPEEEPYMSVLELEVGQTWNGKISFSEPDPPPSDGAVMSDAPSICPISLGADMESATVGPALMVGIATMTYTGTSVAPDVGPVQVAPMVVTVVAVPTAETGDFNPAAGTITGP